MEPTTLLALALLATLAGTLIGAIAIGGVLLVPLMVIALGFDVQVAIAAAMFSYLFSGLLAARYLGHQPQLPKRNVAWLIAGAAPGALAGAVLAPLLTSALLSALVAAITVFAGINALRVNPSTQAQNEPWSPPSFALVGVVAGCASALTGTGGPLILVPLLLLGGMQTGIAILLGQLVQLPIGLMATLGNLYNGQLDLELGLLLAAFLLVGVALGNRLQSKLPQAKLRAVLGVGLICIGGSMLLQLAF